MPVILSRADALTALGAAALADAVAGTPFPSADALIDAARTAWWSAGVPTWLEAFASHPRIGSRTDVERKTGADRALAAAEQAGAATAGEDVLQVRRKGGGGEGRRDHVFDRDRRPTILPLFFPTSQQLAAWNARYEARFGHVYIVCAAGRSAASMLDELKRR